MARRLIAVVFIAATAGCGGANPEPGTAGPTGSITDGRWTALRGTVSYVFWSDSVEAVMYPPQAPAPPGYAVGRDSIEVRDGARSSRHAYRLRGDTLHLQWPASGPLVPMVRIAGEPSGGVRGTWRLRALRQILVMTFRSDSSLVMEIGAPGIIRRLGDTLLLTPRADGPRMIFHKANGRLIGRVPTNRRNRITTFVQRPWGCFGIGELDRNAKECG